MPDYSTEVADICCPYCGELIEVIVDMSVESQEYIEDCSVCCQPITLTAFARDGAAQVTARHENE